MVSYICQLKSFLVEDNDMFLVHIYWYMADDDLARSQCIRTQWINIHLAELCDLNASKVKTADWNETLDSKKKLHMAGKNVFLDNNSNLCNLITTSFCLTSLVKNINIYHKESSAMLFVKPESWPSVMMTVIQGKKGWVHKFLWQQCASVCMKSKVETCFEASCMKWTPLRLQWIPSCRGFEILAVSPYWSWWTMECNATLVQCRSHSKFLSL